MSKIIEIPRRCVVLGLGGVAKPVCHLLSTRYSLKEYLLVDKRKISDGELRLFKNIKVTRLEMDIKPDKLLETISNILKDGDIVFDFLDVMKLWIFFVLAN